VRDSRFWRRWPSLGTLTWYAGFSTLVAFARRWVGDRVVNVVDVLGGLALVGFGGVLAYRSVNES
jgi:putative LysE/RhtB family amino acid efflux pump